MGGREMLLKDKVGVVTGGGSGIGRSTALAMAREGASVMIAGRREEPGLAVVDEIRSGGGQASFVGTDVSKVDDCKTLMEAIDKKFGRLDLAFNNAGGHFDFVNLDETTIEEADWVFDVNLKGTYYCMKYQASLMLDSGGGSIVNNSSIFGVKAMPMLAHYVAAKHGVVGLTRAAALDFAKRDIRVNAVCPGAIKTPAYDRITGGDEHAYDDAIPMGHLGGSRDIAESVIWLMSDQAAFVTGAVLSVDGGMSAM